MSTLGDLLAEHTVLPGSAVDHLHAVVGEWQLLADLSFADYLMWVRRDDGSLVCVAQCRPNTAPTVLLRDAVGTVFDADRMPLIAAAFESGAIGLERAAGQQYSWQQTGVNIEAVPVRYGDWPVMNAERPAVQLFSAYASVNFIPPLAMLSMLGVR